MNYTNMQKHLLYMSWTSVAPWRFCVFQLKRGSNKTNYATRWRMTCAYKTTAQKMYNTKKLSANFTEQLCCQT